VGRENEGLRLTHGRRTIVMLHSTTVVGTPHSNHRRRDGEA